MLGISLRIGCARFARKRSAAKPPSFHGGVMQTGASSRARVPSACVPARSASGPA
jgi:hypothetical protein